MADLGGLGRARAYPKVRRSLYLGLGPAAGLAGAPLPVIAARTEKAEKKSGISGLLLMMNWFSGLWSLFHYVWAGAEKNSIGSAEQWAHKVGLWPLFHYVWAVAEKNSHRARWAISPKLRTKSGSKNRAWSTGFHILHRARLKKILSTRFLAAQSEINKTKTKKKLGFFSFFSLFSPPPFFLSSSFLLLATPFLLVAAPPP